MRKKKKVETKDKIIVALDVDHPKKFKIGIFGSAVDEGDELNEAAFKIGTQIAQKGGIVVTGGCGGLPYQAALGADAEGEIVIGISPFMNLQEHIDNGFPVGPYILIFMDAGKKGRNPTNIHTCDAVIFIAGRTGSLNEFTIAHDDASEGFIIGLLKGSGGVVDKYIPEILKDMKKTNKPTKATILINQNPYLLVKAIFKQLKKTKQ